jgi:hypothetical protein
MLAAPEIPLFKFFGPSLQWRLQDAEYRYRYTRNGTRYLSIRTGIVRHSVGRFWLDQNPWSYNPYPHQRKKILCIRIPIRLDPKSAGSCIPVYRKRSLP